MASPSLSSPAALPSLDLDFLVNPLIKVHPGSKVAHFFGPSGVDFDLGSSPPFFALFSSFPKQKGLDFYLDRFFWGVRGWTSIRACNKQGGLTVIRGGGHALPLPPPWGVRVGLTPAPPTKKPVVGYRGLRPACKLLSFQVSTPSHCPAAAGRGSLAACPGPRNC